MYISLFLLALHSGPCQLDHRDLPKFVWCAETKHLDATMVWSPVEVAKSSLKELWKVNVQVGDYIFIYYFLCSCCFTCS